MCLFMSFKLPFIFKKKYILHPGKVQSRNDGDIHFICAEKLAELYKVDFRDCIVFNEHKTYDSKMIHLYPKYNGKYYLLH